MLDSYRTGNGFPRGQSYGEILRNARREELEAINAALGVRADRIIVQSEPEGTFDTSNGVLPLRASDSTVTG